LLIIPDATFIEMPDWPGGGDFCFARRILFSGVGPECFPADLSSVPHQF
jgi:hypothetical protein